MSSLNDMKLRLAYNGGNRQVDRMIQDKLKSLKKALLYSYQSATVMTESGQQFKCLINPNKVTMELDDKELSIPFEDIDLGNAASTIVATNVKVGSIVHWKENGTYWMIYNQFLEEVAYFRGMMRQCDSEPLDLGNGKKAWIYVKGPDEKSIDWQKTKHFIYNTLNYTLEMYISNNSDTSEFFHRFKKIKYRGKTWEVQAIDDISTNGIIVAYLKEDFTNEFADVASAEESQTPSSETEGLPQIIGPATVYPYDIISYEISGTGGGEWLLSNRRATILEQSDTNVKIEIVTGKSGDISLIYRKSGSDDLVFNIKVQSL